MLKIKECIEIDIDAQCHPDEADISIEEFSELYKECFEHNNATEEKQQILVTKHEVTNSLEILNLQ